MAQNAKRRGVRALQAAGLFQRQRKTLGNSIATRPALVVALDQAKRIRAHAERENQEWFPVD